MKNINKDHWYDGWFYDKIIAPNQDGLFGQIKKLIDPDSTIIDVGCGTGRFSFFVSGICKSVLGIDLSERNIKRADISLAKNPNSKISFKHTSTRKILGDGKEHFDYAVMTYVIHEVDAEERINLLNEISQVSDIIIVGDYLAPKPNTFWSFLNEVVEFMAGPEHYRNYKNYMTNGGIYFLAREGGFDIISEVKNSPSASHIVVLTRNYKLPHESQSPI